MPTVSAKVSCCLILLAGALTTAGDAFADDPRVVYNPRYLSYEEAKAEGLAVEPLPPKSRLPICDTPAPDPGFKSSEEATRTIAQAEALFGEEGPPGRCLVDPRLAVYVVGGAPKGPPGYGEGEYRWAGPESTTKFEGGRTNIEVGDPDICHNCGAFSHFVARPLAFTLNELWAEAGWYEQWAWVEGTRVTCTLVK
jgi:hypothetical protein